MCMEYDNIKYFYEITIWEEKLQLGYLFSKILTNDNSFYIVVFNIWWIFWDICGVWILSIYVIKWALHIYALLHVYVNREGILMLMRYSDVIMDAMASHITSLTIVYSTVYSGADQRKHQSSASLAFVWAIHRRPVNSPHRWPVTRKLFPFDDVIMVITD